MRQEFEALESQILAPYAVKSAHSKGRKYEEPLSPTRTCFQRDRDRIVHSKAFRRLKHKTQVFIATESDHYRSRLTHTLEVAQISRHLARLLRLNEDLSESIALAHDLGHTPFGHSGERELNRLMKDFGGFEHNLQSRRVVDELEIKYPYFRGLNLSYEVKEGLLKHATPWDHPEESEGFMSLESQICNLADEIAYNNHDIDDGLSSGILQDDELSAHVTLWREGKAHVQKEHANLTTKQLKYLINSHLISSQIEDCIRTCQSQLKTLNIQTIEDVQKNGKKVIRFGDEMREKNLELRKYLFTEFYMHHTVYRMNKKGQYIISKLFEAFTSDHKLLPQTYQDRIRETKAPERVVADYIAGMTDPFALKEFQQLYA